MNQLQIQDLADQLKKVVDLFGSGENPLMQSLGTLVGISILTGCGFALLSILLGGGMFKVLGYFRKLTHF